MKGYLLVISALLLSSCGNPNPLALLPDGKCSQSQQLLVKEDISGQIDSIADKNWQRAYTFAAKSFQERIDLDRFTEIISQQYVLLITNKGYTFDSCEIVGEQLVQKITVSGAKDDFRMTYRLTFEEQRLGVVAAAVTQVSQDLAT